MRSQSTVDEVRMMLGFVTDLKSHLGIDKTVRKRANQVTLEVHTNSAGAPREPLEELVMALQETSPTRDPIANPVTVTTRLV